MDNLNDVHDWIDVQVRELEIIGHSRTIKSWLRPCVYIEQHRIKEASLPPGASKFGGSPDLPADFDWPLGSDSNPMCFVMQVNLDDIATSRLNLGLPAKGLMTFFAEYDTGDQPSTLVSIFDPRIPLQATACPYDLQTAPRSHSERDEALRPHRLDFSDGIMLPQYDSCIESPFDRDEEDAYWELLDRFSGTWSDETKDRIGGYPFHSFANPFWLFFERRAAEAGFRIQSRKYLSNNVSKRDRDELVEIGQRVSLIAGLHWIVGWIYFVADRREIEHMDFRHINAYYDCS